jgi:hypothetical protein
MLDMPSVQLHDFWRCSLYPCGCLLNPRLLHVNPRAGSLLFLPNSDYSILGFHGLVQLHDS